MTHYWTQPAKYTVKILVANPEPEKTKEQTSCPTPDSEGDDLTLHASSEELDLDSNSGTNSISKTLNVTQDVHASTAALKVPIIPSKYQDAKYKVDLGSDPFKPFKDVRPEAHTLYTFLMTMCKRSLRLSMVCPDLGPAPSGTLIGAAYPAPTVTQSQISLSNITISVNSVS